MPCAILVNGKDLKFWNEVLKSIYDMLHKDMLVNVRTAMASGFKEVISLIDFSNIEKDTDKQYFINVLN